MLDDVLRIPGLEPLTTNSHATQGPLFTAHSQHASSLMLTGSLTLHKKWALNGQVTCPQLTQLISVRKRIQTQLCQ